MKKNILKTVLLLGTILLTTAQNDSAASIQPGQWGEFLFQGVGSFAQACGSGCQPSSGGNSVDAGSPDWTVEGPGSFIVTDAFLAVDQFAIYDFGLLIGQTSLPSGLTPPVCLGGLDTTNPAYCVNDPNYSHGAFALGLGEHSITIQQIAGIAGAAYFEDVPQGNVAPEPATMFLIGSNLVGLSWILKRRRPLTG